MLNLVLGHAHNGVCVMALEIEGEILKHPEILDACAVGVKL